MPLLEIPGQLLNTMLNERQQNIIILWRFTVLYQCQIAGMILVTIAGIEILCEKLYYYNRVKPGTE